MTPASLDPFSYLLRGPSLEGWKSVEVDVYLRGGQESCDHLENIRVAFRSVIEPRGIDENHPSSIKDEFIRELDLGRTRVQVHSNPQVRTACKVDELEANG